ncbi:Tetratricopeptide repeat protein 18 [Camponotus floridanus]|uniref:Tetratricopeptide repeat protein 18 n=1 Tax=Camponotus floridanus TaxID=104421 RepID=E2AE60_CAMFO|nr:Tetratricopeptide repeat protein 18 [Camponotus floridanus]
MKEEVGISFVVIHKDVVLGESIPLFIDPGFKEPPQVYDVNYAVELSFIVDDRNSMNSVVSTPILIKVMYETPYQRSTNSVKSHADLRGKTIITTPKETSTSSNVIGFCNLDVMPILLGEKSLTERLIVQTAHFSLDSNAVSWQNLPIINAAMMYDGEEIFPSEAKINFLSITIESIYNPPVFFTEDTEYKASTIVYIDHEIPENIIFESGKWTKYRDVERTKQWQSLSKLQSRARLSKWKLSRDYANIKNMLDTKLDLQKKVCQDEPRIEWNFMNRSIMYDVGIETMQKHIVKYKYWPFQFMMAEKSMEKNNIGSKEERSIKLYQCYVDLSELLFPGTKSTRVMTQLYTYNTSDMIEKTGLETNILESWNKESEQSIQSDVEISQNTPLILETGEPVFVIIEVKLYYPLIPCRLESDFSNIIEEMMKPKVTKPYYVYSGDMAEEQYATCIRKLVEIITESYRDELTCFTQYLFKTGTYLSIRSTLKAKVISMLDQKFKTSMNTVHSTDSQNFVASVYTYLVERMHVAINKIVESRLVDEESPKIVISEKLYFYAEEAYELGHVDDARRHHLTAIEANRNEPRAWTKYAIFLLKIGDTERAKECCREAILLNKRDKIAYENIYFSSLLMYGLILAKDQNYREAEIFLKTVTDIYPRFIEGWVILHLLYIRMGYHPGIDLTLRIAEKCMKDDDLEIEISDEDPLTWTTIHCPRDNLYMITIMLLMKMGLYYEDTADYMRALKSFLNACEILPTAETWLGVGIAYYELQQFTEAEAALSEANQIDNRNATVWRYLCLLNMSLERYDEFAQCRRQIAQCTLVILSLLQIAMFTAMVDCDESRGIIRHEIEKEVGCYDYQDQLLLLTLYSLPDVQAQLEYELDCTVEDQDLPKKKSTCRMRGSSLSSRPMGVATDTIRFSKQPRDHQPWEGRFAPLSRENTPLE